MRLYFLIIAIFALTACATTAPSYGPADKPGSTGYTEFVLEQNRYRVTWRGGDTVIAENYALRRAAEIALRDGYDWFEVVGKSKDAAVKSGARTGVTIGGSTGGYRRSGVSVGVGIPLGGAPKQNTTISLEILLGNGVKPEGRDFYNARSVVQNIQ